MYHNLKGAPVFVEGRLLCHGTMAQWYNGQYKSESDRLSPNAFTSVTQQI